MATLGSAYVQIVPSARGISGSIQNVLDPEAASAGKSAGLKIGSFAKKAIVAAGIGTAFVGIVKGAMSEGGKLQQSYIGGLDTLYGEAADAARAYARDAAKAGVSMNTYSEQAVSFGAALKKAYGGDAKKAVEAANTAILDMADNSAKMGTDIQSVQNAYQGFAKQNYTMLDNLKLGYGGTKTEMQRLLKDAEALTGKKYDLSNLGDVYEAIHVIQDELGIAGTAATEAEGTFTGSFASMRAAAQNFLGQLALGMDVAESLQVLTTSASNFFFNNFIPMLGNILKALPGAIMTFIRMGVPALLNGLSTLITTLAGQISEVAKSITAEKVTEWLTTTMPKILSAAGNIIKKFAATLLKNLPTIVKAIARIGLAIVTGLGSAIWAKVTAAANGIKTRFMQPINALKTAAATAAANIRDRFMKPIDAIKSKVKAVIDKVKSYFPFKIGKVMSGIKLPHFSISGSFSLNPPSVPKLSIDWYAQGGIIDGATVFGGVGMGEAGPEAILPLDPFWKKMDEIANNIQGGNTVNIYINGSNKDPKAIAEEVKRVLIKETNQRRLAWQ